MNAPLTFALAVTIATGFAAGETARAQVYPTKPVRVVTGPPGTQADIIMRHIGQRLSERWGQAVVVENRPGSGLIGSAIVAKSPPDGHTLLLASPASHAVAPNLYKSLPYDPVKDFMPITQVAIAPNLVLGHPSVPAANLLEFITYARGRPGVLNYAVAGPGSGGHIAGELFKHMTGVNLVSIFYKGGGAAINALVSGEAQVGFQSAFLAVPLVRTGKIRAYAVASRKRFAVVPDIPTATEAGVPGFESEYWMALFAPANTPHSLIDRINRDVVEVLQFHEMQNALLSRGVDPAPGTPAELAAFMRNETVKLKKVIDQAGIKPE